MTQELAERHARIREAAEEILTFIDAAESATTNEQREKADRALSLASFEFLSIIVGPSLGRVLERERDAPLALNDPGDGNGQWYENPTGVNKALNWLISKLGPVLGSFPALAVSRDLSAAISDNADPWVLALPKRRAGHRNHRDLWRQARLRVVMAVNFAAGLHNESVEDARRRIAEEILDKAWGGMVKATPKERRSAVKKAGKSKYHNPSIDLDLPDAVKAEADLKGDMLKVLIALALDLPPSK
jgi:hypothetical protein